MSRAATAERRRSAAVRGTGPMDLLVAVVQGLFVLHNALYRLTGQDRRLSRQLPDVPIEEAAYGGEPADARLAGHRIFYRRWLPSEPQARGLLVSIHGAGAHGGHFHVIGEYLAPRGFGFYSPDLPGHGLSEGERGAMHDTGLVLDTLAELIELVGREHPNKPVFLLGESLGGIQAMALATRLDPPHPLAGLILSGPELVPQQTTPAPEGATLWTQSVLYARYILHGLFLSRRPVIDFSGREELVTRRPEQAEFSKRDPLRNNLLSLQTLIEGYRLIRSALRIAPKVRLPTLILQAQADLVTDPAAAQDLLEALGAEDRELIYIPEARHGLFYDPETPRVLEIMHDWMARRSP